MINVEITPYLVQHQTQIESLILNIQQNEFGVPVTIEDQPDLKAIPDWYQQHNGNFWVA